MNLLSAVLYDPSSAASKATSSLLAMTVIDSTNLTLSFTAPTHGFVRVHMSCQVVGATTVPQVLLGVMNHSGGAVLGRIAPVQVGVASATTSITRLEADFTVTGLSGAYQWDAAYAVQVVVASTNIKYGGPNDASGADAFGAFVFEVWDPRPLPTAAPAAIGGLLTAPTTANTGLADARQILGTAVSSPATAGILDVNVKNMNNVAATPITTVKAVQGLTTADTITTVTNVTNAPTNGDLTGTMKTSVGTAVQSAMTSQGYTTARGGYMDVLNGLVAAIWANATRTLSAFGFTVATNSDANVTAIKTKTDNLPASPAAVGSQMDFVNAPNSTAITAIQSGLATPVTVDTRLSSTHGAGMWGAAGNGGALSWSDTLTNSVTGQPVPNATIELFSDAPMTVIVASQTTDLFGAFTFSNLIAGTYYWKVIDPGFTTQTGSKVVS